MTRSSSAASRARSALSRLVRLCLKPLGLLVLGSLAAGLVGIFGGWPTLQFASLALLALAVLHIYGVALTIIRQNAEGRPQAASRARSKPAANSAAPATRQEESDEPVTIVVPLYNEERFLADCLDSLQQQTHSNWTAIVVDDASTDDGPKIAAEYAARDERIQLARHLVNSGLSAARNTGLRLAETPLIAFLDSDDMLLPDSLSGRLAAFAPWRDDPEVAGVSSGIVAVPEEADIQHPLPRRTTWGEFHDLITSGADCPFNAHAPLLRTELLRALGGFDESMLSGGEDWDLWQRVMRHGYYFRSAKLHGGLYRRKRNSMVRSLSAAHLEVATELYRKAQEPLAPVSADPGISQFTRPLSEYVEAVPLSARVISFAAMSFVEHGEAGLKKHLSYLPETAGTYLLRHLSLPTLIEQGLMRGLAIAGSVPADIADDFEKMAATVEAGVLQALTELGGTKPAADHRYEAIYLATDAYEAKLALQHAQQAGLAAEGCLILDPATVNGDQGVQEALRDAGSPRCSVNELVFLQPATERIVCFKPHGYGVDLLRAYAERSDTAFELIDPDILTVPDPELLPEELRDRPARPWEVLKGDGYYPIAVLEKEEIFNRKPDVEKLESFRNRHRGERCVIVGNGPSLNDMDLSRLAGENTIAVNGIFYKTAETGFRPKYYVVEDSSVMKENIEEIIAYEVPHKFFPTHYQTLHPHDENVAFFRMNRGFYEHSGPNFCVPRFSTNFASRAYCGQSVTYINLQLAYFMGFAEVYLIGMDFSYHIPESAIRDGDLITSTEDDPNHFNGAYFGAGKTWKDPKLDRVLQNYKSAKRLFEADGRRILNATAGGKLELFDRVDFNATFGG